MNRGRLGPWGVLRNMSCAWRVRKETWTLAQLSIIFALDFVEELGLARAQRIRDPLHGIIEFDESEFEQTMWRAMQTSPFQRLRRVKQLGFSELIYPGATHTRLAHSIGTFHIGRQLMRVIQRSKGVGTQTSRMQQVLAATLFHDIGHGPFSHAFEDVGTKLGLKLASHEYASDRLIRDSELSAVLCGLGSGFSNDVADVIARGRPGTMYEAVVSSQFDADRLDYMQRDRLMTGTLHGAIDFSWLLANLEIGSVPQGVDEESAGCVETFVLGAKSVSAAETYVLGLFQLYETVYLHKATRGAEKLFTELLTRVFRLCRDGNVAVTGLPANHPLVRFCAAPDDMSKYLLLDDSSVWGALPLFASGQDKVVSELAGRLAARKLFKCIELASEIEHHGPGRDSTANERRCALVFRALSEWLEENPTDSHRLLLDRAERAPYKQFQEAKGPLNQIRIRSPLSGELVDLGERSPVVKAIKPLVKWRAYHRENDFEIRELVLGIIEQVANEN